MRNLYIKNTIIILTLICIRMIVAVGVEYKPLDWKDRPIEVQKVGQETHRIIAEGILPKWVFTYGAGSYFSEFNEHTLIKKIILSNPKKSFFIMDIGVDNFAWDTSLKKFINSESTISNDVIVNIIILRRENFISGVNLDGKCKTLKYGNFDIENLIDSLHLKGLSLNNKVDFIISKGCFRHLADPLGTFVQAYNLLTPTTGLFCFDTFFVAFDHMKLDNIVKLNPNILRFILLKLNAPFLIYKPWNFEYNTGIECFIIQKPNDLPCSLPFKYSNKFIICKNMIYCLKDLSTISLDKLPNLKYNFYIGSGFITGFDSLNDDNRYCNISGRILEKPPTLSLDFPFMLIKGNKKLYDWMEEAHNDSEISKYRAYGNIYIKVPQQV